MSGLIFRLSEPAAGSRHRVLSGQATLPRDEKETSWVTVTRTGSFTDPRYGRFDITPEMLLSMVRNFDAGVVGQDICLDVNHNPGAGAAAKILRLSVEGGRLRALVKWTDYGIDAVRRKGFNYLSAEYADNWQDNEAGDFHGPTLLGAGLTVRPVVKKLDPVTLSCEAGGDVETYVLAELAENLVNKAKANMNFIENLKKQLAEAGCSEAVIAQVIKLAQLAEHDNRTEEQAAAAGVALLETAKTLSAAEKQAGAPAVSGKTDPAVKTLSAEEVHAIVAKQLAAQETEKQRRADAVAAAGKQLAELIGKAEGLPDDVKKELAEEAQALLPENATAEQIKTLAEHQILNGNRLAASKALAAMGYGLAGTPHISTPDSSVKQLAQIYQDHLKKSDFAGSLHIGGKDSPFVSKVLSEFDRIYAPQLHAEHKVLAAGETTAANTHLPYGVMREVIRESLSDLNILQLVQTLTDFSAQQTTQIPYEQRRLDEVMNGGLVYEGKPIPFAGVEQKMDMAYIGQIKLALSVTNEVVHFTRAALINWDAVARNIQTNARIVRELIARRLINEIQRTADSYLAGSTDAESVSANAASGIFKTAQFPVVRPYQAVNLQGTAIGLPENPITVKSGANTIGVYDGSNDQASGTYWRPVDFNQGIFQFVDEKGSPKTGVESVTISYSYATNLVKFDLDTPSGSTPEYHLNGLLQKIGSRKAMMSGQRYETPDFLLMSPVLNDTVSNAEQFVSSLKRDGTDTGGNGDLLKVKGIAAYGTNAPNTDMGDSRIVMGVRGTTTYTVAKPFATGELFEITNSNGQPLGKKVAYGEEYNAVHTPLPVRSRYTSVVVYSASARATV